MRKKRARKPTPTKNKLTVLAQLSNFIPGHLVHRLARDCGIDPKARTFTPWNHVMAMLYAQLTRAIRLNDVCDALHHHVGWLARIRAATAPSRNGFSHANKHREAAMAERLFWAVLGLMQSLQPRFASGRRFRALTGRFKRIIHVVDSTIQLVPPVRTGPSTAAQSPGQVPSAPGLAKPVGQHAAQTPVAHCVDSNNHKSTLIEFPIASSHHQRLIPLLALL